MGKNLPPMQEIRVQSLGQEDPLEREWQPTPVFLPGESHGQRSLAGYRGPWGCKEMDKTEEFFFFFFKLSLKSPVLARILLSCFSNHPPIFDI